MSSQASLPISVFQTIDGNPVADGYLVINLSKDCATSSGTQLGAGSNAQIALDSDGAPVGDPKLWENSTLTPNDSVYVVRVYESTGDLVSQQLFLTVGNNPSQTGFGLSFGTSFAS